MEERMERIRRMERLFDFALKAIQEFPLSLAKYEEAKKAIVILSEYYDSEEWRQDYAADEAGLLPKDLKRGVLSEDGLWNLLSDWKELEEQVSIK